MADYQIRFATRSDQPALAKLIRTTFRAAYGADMTEEQLKHQLNSVLADTAVNQMLIDDTFLLAMSNAEPIGFAQLGKFRWQTGTDLLPDQPTPAASAMQVRRLYVAGTHQNQRIGTQLLGQTIEQVFTHLPKVGQLLLDVWEDNHSAQRFYQRFGFRKIGVIPFYLPDGKVDGYDHLLLKELGSG